MPTLRWATIGNVRIFARPAETVGGAPLSVYVGIRRPQGDDFYSIDIKDVTWVEKKVSLNRGGKELFRVPRKEISRKTFETFTLIGTLLVKCEDGGKAELPFKIKDIPIRQ